MSFTDMLPALREMQASLMTDRCTLIRNGIPIETDIPCRVHKDRLFTEPGDPQDANLRSTQEWGITMPVATPALVGDTVIFSTTNRAISVIAGEVLQGDTWETATRIWGTEPKIPTPEVIVTLWRYDPDTDDWAEEGDVTGNIVYDRNAPEEAPVRYAPGGQAMYKNGTLIVALNADPSPKTGDRFDLFGYAATVTMVLPGQPQHTEARFRLDISGDRTS